MSAEQFEILDDTGELHISGRMPDDNDHAARFLPMLMGVARRKVSSDRSVRFEIISPEDPSAVDGPPAHTSEL